MGKRKQIDLFFRPIYGAGNIAKFMGISLPNFHKKYRDDMYEFGCAWKADSRRKAKWVTTGYLLNIFYILRNKKNIGRHR